MALALITFTGCGSSNSMTSSPTPPTTPDGHNEWIWEGGANTSGQAGVYGTKGTAASGNIPGAREQAINWTDASGNLWLFGGNGFDSAGADGYLGDVWEYSAGQWTWVSGSNVIDQPAVYGPLGTASSSMTPGARNSEVHWIDASGSLWLFGGGSNGSFGSVNFLNDLWKYSAGEWTWEGGSGVGGQAGIYGTKGSAAPNNIPGGRFHLVSWTDASGNFWLFGGEALDAYGRQGYLNDLWKFSGGQWTWMGGSNAADLPGVYGVLGTVASTNVPGGREQAVSWIDASGNLWLFGGDG